MKTFPLRVLAPERTFFDGACTSLTVPSIDGMYGLMAQHEDIVLAVVPGKLALRDAEVSLLCADGTETELAPLTAEWNSPQQVDSTGNFSLGEGENWCWLDLNSGGGCQLATHNNRYFYQGAVTYLGATPDGTALGFSLIRDTENGPEWVAFSAALKLDYSIDCLILTPLSGQNPLTNETVPLVLTHSYG